MEEEEEEGVQVVEGESVDRQRALAVLAVLTGNDRATELRDTDEV